MVMNEATRRPQGRRRVVLLLYLLLSPIGIAASLAIRMTLPAEPRVQAGANTAA